MAAQHTLTPAVSFDKQDLFLILFFSILAGIANELVTWFFLYRKESFRKLYEELCDLYEQYCLTTVIPVSRSAILNNETPGMLFMNKSRELRTNRSMCRILTGLSFMALMPVVMSFFEASVVAKLPFVPLPLISLFTHSKILGNDRTDCTATALYTIVSMLSRYYTKMLLGYGSPVSTFKESIINEAVNRESIKNN